MRKLLCSICAIFLILFSFTAPVFAARYENARFGYSLDVPEGFDWLPESDNGDGRRFVCALKAGKFSSPDGEFSVWAGYNVLDHSLKEAADFAAQGHRIAYRRVNAQEGWFVLSWLDEKGRIVYRRDWLKDGTFYAVMFVYPKSSQKFFDGVIKSVTRSFTF